jgi:hypothetical protein
MQGFPSKDSKGYLPLLPKSSQDPIEPHNKLASEVGNTHSLEDFQIISDSLEDFRIPLRPDALILHMNSDGEIVVVDNTGVSIGPNARSRIEDPLFHSEIPGTSAHTTGTSISCSIPLIVQDLYGNLGMSPDHPAISQVPEMYVSYTVPLDQFTGMTSNVTIVADQFLIGSHSIPTLQMVHSTIPSSNVTPLQAPIGKPLRPNPSIPPGYRALNPSIANTA